jgi:hypothetical protein
MYEAQYNVQSVVKFNICKLQMDVNWNIVESGIKHLNPNLYM